MGPFYGTGVMRLMRSAQLARRLFYSYAKPAADHMVVEDIAKLFHTMEDADMVFALFDKDSNGDVTRDDMEMACMSV
jgi:hypothetical protein